MPKDGLTNIVAWGMEGKDKDGKKIKWFEPRQIEEIEFESGNKMICVRGSNHGLVSLNWIIHMFDFDKLKARVRGKLPVEKVEETKADEDLNLMCPKCSESYLHLQSIVTNEGVKGYDCFCEKCKWTGDIYPDEE